MLLPFVSGIRAHYDLAADDLAWFQLDGEQVQINCYSEKPMFESLEVHNIVVGKLAASTTEISQPCDKGNCFKGTKTVKETRITFRF